MRSARDHRRIGQCLQSESEIRGRLKSLLRIFFQTPANEPFQGRWRIGCELRNGWGLFVENRAYRVGGSWSLERLLAHHHLVQDGAQRENVCPLVRRLASSLIGGHVVDLTKRNSGQRDRRGQIR